MLVIATALVIIFLPRIRIATAINGLSALSNEAFQSHRRFLMEHEDRVLVDELLLEAISDDGKAFRVRREACAMILQRVGIDPHLSRLLRQGSLGARAVVTTVLAESREVKNFNYFADDPSFRIHETVRGWLERRGDATRWHAIQLARRLQMQDSLPLVLAILDEPTQSALHPNDRYQLVVAAAAAIETFGACSEMERVLKMAEADEDLAVRRACLEIAVRTAFIQGGPCPGSLDSARVSAALASALASGTHELMQQGLLLISRVPALGRGQEENIRTLLDRNPMADPGKREVQRRHALEALSALGDSQVVSRIAVYAHDPMPSVRSSALEASTHVSEPAMTSMYVGLLQNETESDVIFHNVLRALREASGGQWIGMTDAMKYKASQDPTGFRKTLTDVFRNGEAEGLVRQHMVERWWRWHAQKQGLSEAEIDRAYGTHQAFWEAAARRDVEAARAALAAYGPADAALFLYEEAWLKSR